ncbi:MAG TPA: efflux RND transporter permease subunit [Saprospiraceae bacterium]|nr:efflux RND transporter permease subunit [Saprospiraceae bacterium]
MNLTQFSVKNYQFTLVIFLMIAVVGVMTLMTMPRAEDPQINPPTYFVTVIYPGTSPQDMEELIVKPIENRIYELDNIDYILTTIEDGLAIVKVEFKYGENIDNKYQEMVREVNALQSQLPAEIYSIKVERVDPSDVNILQIALISENASLRSLKKEADRLKENLEKITDLKRIKISGVREEIVRIDVHTDRMAELGIPMHAIISSLQSENANIPGGSVTAGARSFNVKTSGKFKTLEDIEGTIIFQSNGSLTYLRDVANVDYKFEEEKHITRLNGYRCVLVSAALKNGSNISQSQKEYNPLLNAFAESMPPNIALVKHFDQADNVSKRLAGLGKDFLIAIFLVIFTLLPLGFRASLLVMLAIPLSLALGLVGLNTLGYSLNQLSIVGLVVALGLLVDDSIVVVENIERWLRKGFSRKEAAIKATQQITLAVLGCTATLAIAFLPLIFLPAASGEFIRGLPVAVIASVIASMFVSLTIVPFIASRMLKEPDHPDGNLFLRILKKVINRTYARVVSLALRFPGWAMLIAISLFTGSLFIFPVIGFKLFPTSEKPMFVINVRMPQQTNIVESDRISRMIEDSLAGYHAIHYYTTNVGRGNPRIYYNEIPQQEKTDYVQFFIQMSPKANPDEKKELIQELRKQFSDFPYAMVEVKDFEQGPPIEAPISIRVFGDHLDTLRQLAFEVEKIVQSHPGSIYINNELNLLKTDLKVDIHKEKARTLGVMTADVDRAVRMSVSGFKIGQFSNESGDEYDLVVNAPRERFPTTEIFHDLYITNSVGIPIPLRQIANLEFETSPTFINHFNKTRFVKITAFTQKNSLANDILKDIVPELEQLKMPEGYYYKLSGEAESEEEAFGSGFTIVILMTVFLFIAVLLLQFKNFKGTLIVLSVIPLGIVGGVSALWLTGYPMSFVAILGFIGLAGIEVKNSILLVDFTNQLRIQGVELSKAIEQAGEIRFLPVVLTAATAIGGLTPLALNTNPLISPLAFVIIGGLISSTLLSRIVTPVMYKLIPPKLNDE